MRVSNDAPFAAVRGGMLAPVRRRIVAVWVIGAALVASSAGGAATAPRIAATIRAGVAPIGVASGAGSLWTADYGGGSLVRIDPAHNRVVKQITLGASPYRVAFGGGALWVSAFDEPFVSRVDPGTNRVVARVRVSSTEQAGLAVHGGELWVAVYGGGRVARIDVATNKVVHSIAVGGNPETVVFAAGSAWVPNEDHTVARIDPVSGKIVARIRVGADPDDAMFCRGRLWVSDLRGSRLSVIDPATNAVVARPNVGVGSMGMACDAGVWVANYDTGKLLQLDASGKVLRRLEVGVQPRELLIAFGDLWVSNQRSGTVVRVRRGR
jgi:YVTN family beta-propeller protein